MNQLDIRATSLQDIFSGSIFTRVCNFHVITMSQESIRSGF